MSEFYITRKDGKTYLSSTPPGTIVCDFCSSTPVMRKFEAMDVELMPGRWSEGGWAACERCAKLIDAGDRQGLIDRALIMLSSKSDDQEFLSIMAQGLKMIHDKFWESRK